MKEGSTHDNDSDLTTVVTLDRIHNYCNVFFFLKHSGIVTFCLCTIKPVVRNIVNIVKRSRDFYNI